MSLTLLQTQTLFSIIISTIAYFISVTFNEFFQSKVALFLGDDTADKNNYSSLNPLDHFHFLNFILLLILRVTWPVNIPVNINNFKNNKMIRVIFIFLSESIASLLLTLISLIISLSWLGLFATNVYVYSVFTTNAVPLATAFESFPNASSFAVVSGLLLAILSFLNIFIAAYSLILTFFRSLLLFAFQNNFRYKEYFNYIYFIGIFLTFIYFGDFLMSTLINMVILLASNIAFLLRIL